MTPDEEAAMLDLMTEHTKTLVAMAANRDHAAMAKYLIDLAPVEMAGLIGTLSALVALYAAEEQARSDN